MFTSSKGTHITRGNSKLRLCLRQGTSKVLLVGMSKGLLKQMQMFWLDAMTKKLDAIGATIPKKLEVKEMMCFLCVYLIVTNYWSHFQSFTSLLN
jgi:hypothetical protein